MSIASKLNAALTGIASIATTQGAILAAIQNVKGVDTTTITDALAKVDADIKAVQSELGNDDDGTAPAETPAPTPEPTTEPTPDPTEAPAV